MPCKCNVKSRGTRGMYGTNYIVTCVNSKGITEEYAITAVNRSVANAVAQNRCGGYDFPGDNGFGGGAGCLALDTLVATPSGKVAIGEIKAGDEVLCVAHGEEVLTKRTVSEVKDEDHDLGQTLFLKNGERIEMSVNQPVLTVSGPVKSAFISSGAGLVCYGDEAVVERATPISASLVEQSVSNEDKKVCRSLDLGGVYYFLVGETGLAVTCNKQIKN